MAVTLNANTSTGFIATSDTSGVLQLQTGGTAAVTVDASQQVGIGTASPGYKLDVSGVVSSNDTVRVTSGTTVTIMSTAGGGEGTVGTSSNHALQFRTNNTERMRIDTSGNVGIGTASPLAKFEVRAGRSYFQANSEAYSIYMSYASGTAGFFIGSPSADAMSFSSSGGAERMRIDSSGNLLVGTTSRYSTEKASIYSASGTDCGLVVQNLGGSGNNGIRSVIATGGNNTSTAHFQGTTSGVANWYLYGNGTTSYSSDARLKKNIETTRDGYIDDVMKLRVVKYNWKNSEDGTPKELGMIAQEIEEVFPNLVQDDLSPISDEDPIRYKQVKWSVLPFILLKALQEQQAIITQLQADVAALKGTA